MVSSGLKLVVRLVGVVVLAGTLSLAFGQDSQSGGTTAQPAATPQPQQFVMRDYSKPH